jgi:hypothetical protein
MNRAALTSSSCSMGPHDEALAQAHRRADSNRAVLANRRRALHRYPPKAISRSSSTSTEQFRDITAAARVGRPPPTTAALTRADQRGARRLGSQLDRASWSHEVRARRGGHARRTQRSRSVATRGCAVRARGQRRGARTTRCSPAFAPGPALQAAARQLHGSLRRQCPRRLRDERAPCGGCWRCGRRMQPRADVQDLGRGAEFAARVSAALVRDGASYGSGLLFHGRIVAPRP